MLKFGYRDVFLSSVVCGYWGMSVLKKMREISRERENERVTLNLSPEPKIQNPKVDALNPKPKQTILDMKGRSWLATASYLSYLSLSKYRLIMSQKNSVKFLFRES